VLKFDPHRQPTAPGVYLMKDAAGEILYVGKAKDLRKRLRSYLKAAGDGRALRLSASCGWTSFGSAGALAAMRDAAPQRTRLVAGAVGLLARLAGDVLHRQQQAAVDAFLGGR